jgi:hypothetical protein
VGAGPGADMSEDSETAYTAVSLPEPLAAGIKLKAVRWPETWLAELLDETICY